MTGAQPLTLDVVKNAVISAAAFRCRQLQAAGGAGDKVFPPTFAGALYAIERRRVPGREEPVQCVLLDSVQSQARDDYQLREVIVTSRRRRPRGARCSRPCSPPHSTIGMSIEAGSSEKSDP